jgi:hypothetical protein
MGRYILIIVMGVMILLGISQLSTMETSHGLTRMTVNYAEQTNSANIARSVAEQYIAMLRNPAYTPQNESFPFNEGSGSVTNVVTDGDNVWFDVISSINDQNYTIEYHVLRSELHFIPEILSAIEVAAETPTITVDEANYSRNPDNAPQCSAMPDLMFSDNATVNNNSEWMVTDTYQEGKYRGYEFLLNRLDENNVYRPTGTYEGGFGTPENPVVYIIDSKVTLPVTTTTETTTEGGGTGTGTVIRDCSGIKAAGLRRRCENGEAIPDKFEEQVITTTITHTSTIDGYGILIFRGLGELDKQGNTLNFHGMVIDERVNISGVTLPNILGSMVFPNKRTENIDLTDIQILQDCDMRSYAEQAAAILIDADPKYRRISIFE